LYRRFCRGVPDQYTTRLPTVKVASPVSHRHQKSVQLVESRRKGKADEKGQVKYSIACRSFNSDKGHNSDKGQVKYLTSCSSFGLRPVDLCPRNCPSLTNKRTRTHKEQLSSPSVQLGERETDQISTACHSPNLSFDLALSSTEKLGKGTDQIFDFLLVIRLRPVDLSPRSVPSLANKRTRTHK
jgi:hypothetical protein